MTNSNSFGLSDKICDSEANCLSCGAPLPADRAGQQKFTGGKSFILVLGNDDDLTLKLLSNAKEAVSITKRNIDVTLITDEQVIASYNLRSLPALIINGSIVSQGIISDTDSITADIEFLDS